MPLRFSELKTFISCPTLWEHTWKDAVEGPRRTDPSAAQLRGIEIHKRIEDGENICGILDYVMYSDTKEHEKSFSLYSEILKVEVTGTIDLVSQSDSTNYIYDIKTTARPSIDDRYNYPVDFLQVAWYGMHMTALNNKPSIGAILEIEVNSVGKPVNCKHYCIDVDKLVPEVRNWVFKYLEAKNLDQYFPENRVDKNPNHCKAYGKFCDQYKLCWSFE